ncbi:hypothetical protein As57867_004566, partial [Aphanomyces stellatus]
MASSSETPRRDGGDFTALASPVAIAIEVQPATTTKPKTPWREQPNPMATANWFSLVTMLWLDPLIRRGARRTLNEEDVWKLCPEDTAGALHTQFSARWEAEKAAHAADPRYGRALWKTLEAKTLWTTALYGLYSALMLIQPTIIKSLLEFLAAVESDTPISTTLGISSGYGLAALLAALSLVSVTLVDFGQYLTSNLGVNAKSIVMDSVYLKTLTLSSFAKQHMSSGEIVTLSTVDSERVFQGYLVGPWVVVAPATLVAIFVLIGIDMGWDVGLVGGAAMALVLYWGYVSAKAIGQVRRQVLTVQAERVKLTNEILQGVRVVKLYAWEPFLEAQIAAIRVRELALLKNYQFRRVLNTVMLSIAPVLSLALCLAVYVARGSELKADVAFTALAYMNVARLPCTIFSSSIMFASEAMASCARVGAFMTSHELSMDTLPAQDALLGEAQPKIEIANGRFSWLVDPNLPLHDHTTDESTNVTLHDINVSIQPKTLTIVVGAVGSGKSSLISAILGEIHQVGGTRELAGRISYVAQEAWIQHASLKQNILFTDALDDARYEAVVSACQLKPDLAILPEGDAT